MRAIRGTGALSAVCVAMAVAGVYGQDTLTDAAVRSDDKTLTELIRQGTEQSETFRTLVGQIGAMNGIVYVQKARCRYSVRACLLLKIVPAGPRRIMFVQATVQADRAETIAAIGHELRHVTEVLEHEYIDSTGEMFLFYRNFASDRQTDYFETAAARAVTESVRTELRRFEASHPRVAELRSRTASASQAGE